MPYGPWLEQKALIVVKTYPAPSQRDIEVSCTAAITASGNWMRIFPVPFRLMDGDKQFHKYEWIQARVRKANDPRPESHNIDPDSISIVGSRLPSSNHWEARKRAVSHLKKHCMCCIKQEHEENGSPTLGFFRPYRIVSFLLTADSPTWSEPQLARLRQTSFLDRELSHELEKIPFKFRYRYVCDHADCTGHTMLCTDWEMSEAYRRWKQKYGDLWEEKFRERFEHEMINEKDLHFFVGTVNNHPKEWIIVGLFYPPLRESAELWENPVLF